MEKHITFHRASRARVFLSLILAAGVGLAALLSAGCGSDPGNRHQVSGEVSVDKVPLDSGSITFLPEQDGPAATGEIVNGRFQIGREGGPGAGSYKVVILSSRATGKQVPSRDDPSVLIDEVINTIPTRYNVQTTLRAIVKADGENSFPFALDSRPETAQRKGRGRTRNG